MALGEIAFEVALVKDESAQGEGPGSGEGHDQQEAVGMVGEPNTGRLPLPAITLKVTKTSFLPIAKGVILAACSRVVGQQTPEVAIALRPHHPNGALEPAGLLENLPLAYPGLTRRIDQMLEGAFASLMAQDDTFLDTKQVVPAQALHHTHQLRRGANAPVRLH